MLNKCYTNIIILIRTTSHALLIEQARHFSKHRKDVRETYIHLKYYTNPLKY